MTMTSDDAELAKKAVAPRVSVQDLENFIVAKYFVNGSELERTNMPVSKALRGLTLCICICKNGYIIVGQSAPASLENFDQALGERFAAENALKQLWPMMGFNLRTKLSEAEAS